MCVYSVNIHRQSWSSFSLLVYPVDTTTCECFNTGSGLLQHQAAVLFTDNALFRTHGVTVIVKAGSGFIRNNL